MDKLAELLKQLADKLGTTVEHLWSVVLQQVQVEIQLKHLWMNIGLFGWGGLAAICLIVFIVELAREQDEELVTFTFFAMLVLAVIGGSVYYYNYSELLTLTTNPEYWALRDILGKLK